MIKREKLGEGTFGIVYSGLSPVSGREFAVKRNLVESDMSFIGVTREVDLLVKLRRHPYIIRIEEVSFKNPFKDTCFSPLDGEDRTNQKNDIIHFVFRQAAYDMSKFIYGAAFVDFQLIKKYMLNILLGTEYLHNRKIIHRDLKPSNILIFGDEKDIIGIPNVAKICDFGLSKPYTYQGSQTPNTVTSWYRAPEIALGYPDYDYKVDVWSLGCILFEMIAKKPFLPEVQDDNDEILSAILFKIPEDFSVRKKREIVKTNKWREVKLLPKYNSRDKKSIIEQLSLTGKGLVQFEQQAGKYTDFVDLLTSMLKFDRNDRVNVTQCINHVFFKDYSELIEKTRALMKPETEDKIIIVNCIEREWMKNIITEIYNKRHLLSWYNTRAIFQAIDLFDRYLITMSNNTVVPPNFIESDLKGLFDTRFEAEIKFMTCIYICIKYFSSIHYPFPYKSIVNDDYKTDEALFLAENFESSFIINCLGYEIYRPTIYEAADNFGDILDEQNIRDLIMIYTSNKSCSGMTPTELYQHYRTNLRGKGDEEIMNPIKK
jgi:serine/threonine protein kinase